MSYKAAFPLLPIRHGFVYARVCVCTNIPSIYRLEGEAFKAASDRHTQGLRTDAEGKRVVLLWRARYTIPLSLVRTRRKDSTELEPLFALVLRSPFSNDRALAAAAEKASEPSLPSPSPSNQKEPQSPTREPFERGHRYASALIHTRI